MTSRRYTVSEAARISRVTVRTLHHYDELGLLSPSHRSRAGYRLYDARDLQRLSHIVMLRELGFTLEAVGEVLAGDGRDLRTALEQQRARLSAELARAAAMLRAVEGALASQQEEIDMEKLFQGIEQFDGAHHREEAEQRWGDSDAYRESARRTARYGKEEFALIQQEAAQIVADWAALLRAGADAASSEVGEVVERHRLHIDRWFYPCSRAHHEKLSELYVSDPRFAEYFDRSEPGLAAFAAASIRAAASK